MQMLLSAEKISKRYGDKLLFDDASLYLLEGDKVGVIGINGAGKTTLLNILAQTEDVDEGKITKGSGVRIEYIRQNPVLQDDLTILEQVFAGSFSSCKETKEYEAKTILSKFGLTEYDRRIRDLSGGQKKRVAIASALVHPWDILILDEPTNHLDNDMVLWLEKMLVKSTGAIIMVTHDRYFLDRVTRKIIEMDRGKIYTYPTNYSGFLALKLQREESLLGTERKARSLLRKEQEWMLQGAKARGTKSKDRIARFEALKGTTGRTDSAKLEMSSLSTRLGKKTVELHHISKSFGDRRLVRDFSHMIARDARIGIVGKNGCGKSTLLNMISGTLAPDSGTVVFGETIRLGYFTQNGEEMDTSLRVLEYIRNIAESIDTPDGKISASMMLEKFLFPPDLQWNTIQRLSGGERRRLYLLSILMGAPNMLLMDEPTNDLDIQTLTILEDYLESFAGPVIAVSHDRFFLDKAVDTIFAFQEDGKIEKYQGSYSTYLARSAEAEEAIPAAPSKVAPERNNIKKRKLAFTYKEQREHENIDGDISSLEEKIRDAETQIQIESSNYVKLQELMAQKDTLEKNLEEKMERWVYLNDLAEKIEQAEKCADEQKTI